MSLKFCRTCLGTIIMLVILSHHNLNPRVVVVGKIIIDEHRLPSQDSTATHISVGGGGPQAAFGAAMALAILSNDMRDLPRCQPVSFVAPVGGKD
jgi:hypothetical protein